MDRDPEERELLARAAAGDAAAFEPIVTRHRDRAYRYALSLMRNHHDALDLSQDAFARAYRSLNRFDLSRPFLPWFLRILRNLCLNALERSRRRPERPGRAEGDEVLRVVPSSAAGPEALVRAHERAAQVQTALSRLSDLHREVLVLRHFEDMTYEQIADVLGVPIGTVMSRLFNARKRLASELRRSDAGE